jgi:hypothetical protein
MRTLPLPATEPVAATFPTAQMSEPEEAAIAWSAPLVLGWTISDEGIRELTDLLTKNRVFPVLTRPDSGTVLVQMTLDATNDMAAGAAAEDMLGDRAHEVWVALGLPPLTITFVDAKPKSDHQPLASFLCGTRPIAAPSWDVPSRFPLVERRARLMACLDLEGT